MHSNPKGVERLKLIRQIALPNKEQGAQESDTTKATTNYKS
jgi:hypothetical protein